LRHRGRILCWAGLVLFASGSLAISLLNRRFGDHDWMAAAAAVAYGYQSFLLMLFPLLLLRDALWFAGLGVWTLAARRRGRGTRPEDSRSPGAERRRAWISRTNIGVVVAAAVLAGVGYWQAQQRPRVVRETVRIRGLPADLEWFRIAVISDTHLSRSRGGVWLSHVVDDVNGLHPDMVAVIGDLADGRVARMRQEIAPLARLGPAGRVFFVTGNHEYRRDGDNWAAEVEKLPIPVLRNQHVLIRRGQGRLLVAGVIDLSQRGKDISIKSDPAAALAGAPECDVRVLLAHQPKSAIGIENILGAAGMGYDLQLSGHTHGGQMWPYCLIISTIQPYLAGLYRCGDMQVFVTRGAGYWGPPNRLGVPPEIAEITLVRGE
jgi:uncharacterized protein